MGRQLPQTHSQFIDTYPSDEAGGSSDDESNDDETKQTPGTQRLESISNSHDQLLDYLSKVYGGALPKLGEDVFESGQGGMTILHKIVLMACRSSQKPPKLPKLSPEARRQSGERHTPLSAGRGPLRPSFESYKSLEPPKPLEYGKIPFEHFRLLVNQILSSEEGQKLLFKVDDDFYGQTALGLAASSGKWEALECLLNSERSLDAAILPPKHGSSNNCLHKVIKRYMNKRQGSTSPEKGSQFLWKCIEKLISKPETTKKFYMDPIKGDGGNTPLHLAVEYKEKINPKNQGRLILELIKAYPESMGIRNDADQSPYQYRIRTMKGKEVKQDTDKILFKLKDHYMHYEDRNEAARYLYGVGEEVAMELDLSEHTDYLPQEESLQRLGRHLKLENILRYVDFPRIVVKQVRDQQVEVKSKNRPGKMRSEIQEFIERKDLGIVFGWLRKSGVKKIIRVRVDDSEDPPHSDEVIENSLRDFKVEVLDWVKTDLCSTTILEAAPDVKEVYLYSSGNRAVLQAWSGDDGLKKLDKLKTVHITINQRLESLKRTKEYLSDFRDRLSRQISAIEIHSNITQWGGDQGVIFNHPGEISPEQTHKWITHMNEFVNFVQNINVEDLKHKPVKVALIDDGVDGAHQIFSNNIKGGVSFCSPPGYRNNVYSYCVPSGCHGTQMAGLIHQVCPQVELYIARIQDMEFEGTRQIDAESTVKAINWAIAQGVDIISMSWTFQRTRQNKPYLDNEFREAIQNAVGKDILVFCSTSDMGSCANDKIYPACLPSVFAIGAAKSSGNEREWTEPSSNFMFPGEDLKAETPTYIESKKKPPVSGSSLATALASGLAALILHCNDIVNHQPRKNVRNYLMMERAFKKMVNQNQPNAKYIRAWEHLKPEFNDLPDDKAIEGLGRAIEELFR